MDVLSVVDSTWGASGEMGPFGGLHASPFHPKIDCLNDLARAIIRRAGLPLTNSLSRPPDNLATGPVFPVYPEIGRRLGVAGDYLFKLGRRNA